MNIQPIGYFVHHQGRGHAERATALLNVLVKQRPVEIFTARPDMFKGLSPAIGVTQIPSLFEPTGNEPDNMRCIPEPGITHCAPLGWQTIRDAMAALSSWFSAANPALFVTDVSAELGQLARLCSVPHVAVLQHGRRSDSGHMAAYESAVGILAPYAPMLEQDDRPSWMLAKTHYAPGLGVDVPSLPSRDEARRVLGLPLDLKIVCVIGGGGGDGLPSTPLTLGARQDPHSRWFTLGKVTSEWHETSPGNLTHLGWVQNAAEWIAAADRIVSSCGNTTVHTVLAARKPWIVVPEWRYFDEQLCKAISLEKAGLAAMSPHWPSHRDAWQKLWEQAERIDTAWQAEFIDPDAAIKAADWMDGLASSLWDDAAEVTVPTMKAIA
ncbi:hypothetical protein [Erythrobacter sp. R86502]|uniref:hypothetical protein n=1 Tax=Erythrobacter sp. R86502 TaxID=3093846 RepID=UPI0036D364A5